MFNKQIRKFIIVGIINTLVYFSIYSLFLVILSNYKVAVLLATIVGVLFSFKTFGTYVFDNQNNSLIYKFILVYVMLYGLNILIISILYETINNYYICGFLASGIIAVLTYILNKKFVFIKKEK